MNTLFIVSLAMHVGGYLLLIATAALVHFLSGQFDVGALVFYAVPVRVCLAYQNGRTAEAA